MFVGVDETDTPAKKSAFDEPRDRYNKVLEIEVFCSGGLTHARWEMSYGSC